MGQSRGGDEACAVESLQVFESLFVLLNPDRGWRIRSRSTCSWRLGERERAPRYFDHLDRHLARPDRDLPLLADARRLREELSSTR